MTIAICIQLTNASRYFLKDKKHIPDSVLPVVGRFHDPSILALSEAVTQAIVLSPAGWQ